MRQHVPTLALADGLTLEECSALADWQDSKFFTARERAALIYADTMTREIAVPDAVFEEVRRHLATTYFAWIGECDDVSPFYYRIHSPVVLIEFDHLRGIALDNEEPARTHIHTIVRTPNGNDYGKDLLRQHHQRFHQ